MTLSGNSKTTNQSQPFCLYIVCAVAVAFPDGEMIVRRETMEGYIGEAPAGENGFGYDPIFYPTAYGCSSAELSSRQKNEISHRGKALMAIRKEIEKRI